MPKNKLGNVKCAGHHQLWDAYRRIFAFGYLLWYTICRYSFASIRTSLEKHRDLFAGLHVDGAMMPDDEPNLKVLLLLQALRYRLNAIAIALDLPDRHCYTDRPPGSAAADTTISAASHSVAAVMDWILQEHLRETGVFGSPEMRKESITEVLKAEMEILRAMVS